MTHTVSFSALPLSTQATLGAAGYGYAPHWETQADGSLRWQEWPIRYGVESPLADPYQTFETNALLQLQQYAIGQQQGFPNASLALQGGMGPIFPAQAGISVPQPAMLATQQQAQQAWVQQLQQPSATPALAAPRSYGLEGMDAMMAGSGNLQLDNILSDVNQTLAQVPAISQQLAMYATQQKQQQPPQTQPMGYSMPFTASSGSGTYTPLNAPNASQQDVPSKDTSTAVTTRTSSGNASGELPADIPYRDIIIEKANKYRLKPSLVAAVIRQESNFKADAGSSAGARGLMQLMPATAKELGVTNREDPAQSIEGGCKYLAKMMKRYNNDETLALSAYNAGPGNVDNGRYKHLAETQKYAPAILGFKEQYESNVA